MKHFAVIGDPIAHSLSHVLHQEIYRQLGLEAEFEKIHVMPNALHSFMKENELDGFNVTIPHKQSIIPFLDELDESVQTIGAVNCVHNGKGYNTDWIGFTMAMELNDVELSGKDCLIVGAGGAARAIAFALIKSEVKSITIINRTIEKAENLKQWAEKLSDIPVHTQSQEHVNISTSLNPGAQTHEHLIINCTPLGMWPDTESMPEVKIQKDQVLADTIYNPLETAWLKTGKEKGAKTIGGLDMFIAQGLASADIWFGEKISEKIKLEDIKKVLKSELC
ncbi:MAG: shikimate dehydrogenase [Candidatus Marinimicrobia bacterium]|nr:shikimate dehydrogenase [Candidatus Neomarinimicrobiota bacterium]